MVVWMGDEPDVRAWVNADQAAGEFRVRYADLFDAEARRHEQRLHAAASVGAAEHVLDVGCGTGAGGPARPAANVEHMLGGTDAGGGMQPLFMQTRLGIEQFGVPDPELPGGLVRIDPRPDLRLITHPHHHPRTLAPAYMPLILLPRPGAPSVS